MKFDVSDKYGPETKIDTQSELPMEVLNSASKGDSGPVPVKKTVAKWGLLFIILYSLFFIVLVNYRNTLKIPQTPIDVFYQKPSYYYFDRPQYTVYIPLGSALVITVTALVVISLFKYKSLRKPQE